MKIYCIAAVLVGFLPAPVASGQTMVKTPAATAPQAAGCQNCSATATAVKPIPGSSETMVVGRIENLIPIAVLSALGCEPCSAKAVQWALDQGSSFEDIERTLETLSVMRKLECFQGQFGPEAAARLDKPLAAAREALARAKAEAGKR